MSLFQKFLELSIPEAANSKLFNAVALDDFAFAKIGINHEGFPVILISSKIDKVFLLQKNIKLKYIELTHNLECRISDNNSSKIDNFSVIIFKSSHENLQSYFLGITQSLLNSLSLKPTQSEVFETFKNFIEIFRSLSESPTKTVQGLWAELLLIESSKSPETLINFWHNVPEEKFDFNADKQKIEVKSSSSLERVHIFSAEQLNPTNNSQVIVASIFTKQVLNGQSIIDLLAKIESKISDSSFTEKLYKIISKTLGNTFEQTMKIKYDYDLAKNSLRFYRHQDVSKIERTSIPSRVSEVKFKSDLTYILPVNPAIISADGQLFKSI